MIIPLLPPHLCIAIPSRYLSTAIEIGHHFSALSRPGDHPSSSPMLDFPPSCHNKTTLRGGRRNSEPRSFVAVERQVTLSAPISSRKFFPNCITSHMEIRSTNETTKAIPSPPLDKIQPTTLIIQILHPTCTARLVGNFPSPLASCFSSQAPLSQPCLLPWLP
ncbi:unnamed protein product [Linum trigynum]|uniref:Uncharacterized protein n=1 Tax=Linum trigynum TaxID=586398 RepID=A0AAV2GKR6_9ROSI